MTSPNNPRSYSTKTFNLVHVFESRSGDQNRKASRENWKLYVYGRDRGEVEKNVGGFWLEALFLLRQHIPLALLPPKIPKLLPRFAKNSTLPPPSNDVFYETDPFRRVVRGMAILRIPFIRFDAAFTVSDISKTWSKQAYWAPDY